MTFTVPELYAPASTLYFRRRLDGRTSFKPSAPFLTPDPTPWVHWDPYEQNCATDPMQLKTAHSSDPALLTTVHK